MSKSFQSVPPCSSNKSQVARVSGEFGLKTKILVVFLVLLVTTHSLPTVFGAPDNPDSPNAQTTVLSNLREAAESRRDELFYLFEEEVPSEILSQLQGAIAQMNWASALEDEDQFKAAQSYLEALKLFRESWESYSDYKPEAGEESLVVVFEDLTQEPQPQNIEEEIKNNKEKRIIKFQEKILKNIEDEEGPESEESTSVIETIKSGLEHIKKMIQQGSLTSAVEVLKVTVNHYQNSVDEISTEQSSKLDRTLSNMESKLDREEEKESKSNSRSIDTMDTEEKTNNGNRGTQKVEETEKTNNGNDKGNENNGNSEYATLEATTSNGNGNGKPETRTDSIEDQSNNGQGNGNDSSEPKEKSNNGNGNGNNKTETEEDPSPEPVEEKSNNGNGNSETQTTESEEEPEPETETKANNDNGKGNRNDSPESVETQDEPEPEPEPEPKTNNGNGNNKTETGASGNSSNDNTGSESNGFSKKDDKEKSNNGKNK